MDPGDGDGAVTEPDKPDTPEQPADGWWDRHFTADEIARALASVRTQLGRPTDPSDVLGEVRTYWPEFGPFMASYGVQDSPEAKVALLATLWVEVGWSLVPTDEDGDYDYFERNYGYQTTVGQMLGNIYPGDGARYHGRGYQLTGRGNYAWIGGLLGVDLINDPDELNDPTLAAGAMVIFCAEKGVFDAAQRGDWVAVRKIYNGGLNGWDRFLLAVNMLLTYADADSETPWEPEALASLLRKVVDLGATRLGDPYVWDGEAPGGFDCSGFVAWAYRQALGIRLTSYTDALYGETLPLSQEQALPGDIILFEYVDPSQPGVRFPHTGLVTDDPGIVLDARGGVGVGYHALVQGAVARYRRVKMLPVEDPEEKMWRDKFINTVAYLGDNVADSLETERSKLDDYGDPPKQPKSDSKMSKGDWQKYAEAMEAWAKKVRDNTDDRYKGIGAVGSELRRVRTEEVGPRPQ